MKSTLFISALCVFLAQADMSRIADILTAESTDLNNCDLINTNSQLSLGHKIAQVVCDEQTSELNRRFIGFVKYVLFGIICSISTYLVFATNDSKAVDYKRTETVESEGEPTSTPTTPNENLQREGPVVEKQESECVEPRIKEIIYEVVKLEQVDVLPEKQEAPQPADVSLEEKSLDSTTALTCPVEDDEEEDSEKQFEGGDVNEAEQCDLSEYTPTHPPVLNLEQADLVDFENYKNNVDRFPSYFDRPRSYSDPNGCERYIQYSYTLEDAIQNGHVGEPPAAFNLPLNAIPSHLDHERLDEIHEPGSPDRNKLNLIENLMQAQAEPGSVEEIPPEQKINERKPMVFVGGVSASTTPLELVTELKKQGFNVTVVPRIRYGVSFGFCPDLVLSSQAEVEKLLGMGRVWVKDRWVDIRPYIPKEEPQAQTSKTPGDAASMESRTPPQQHNQTQMIHEVVEPNVEYISHEDLVSSCPTSPAPSANMTPTVGNSSPVTPGAPHQHYMPHMNPPFIQMTPVMPFSPGSYHAPQMMQHFFPHPPPEQRFHVLSPPAMNGLATPSPPEQHPMQLYDEHHITSPTFRPLDAADINIQHPICHGGVPPVYKLVSN